MRLRATLEPHGPAAALILTEAQLAELGGGKQPPVRVTINGVTLPLRAARRGGQILVGFSKAARAEFGIEPGDQVDAEIVLDDAPRAVDVPDDLAAALAANPAAQAAFDALSFTNRKEMARTIAEAKRPETRARRLAVALQSLGAT